MFGVGGAPYLFMACAISYIFSGHTGIYLSLIHISFDFINGFHDTATAVATSISTRALSPKAAIALCAVFNFVGAFLGTEVAKTVGDGIVCLLYTSKHNKRRI